MTRLETFSIVILRIFIGWFFIYQGVNAILTTGWSLPFIGNAHTFPEFYSAVTTSDTLPLITLGVKGLFFLVGFFLVTGLFARIGALLGILVMLFFYFPLLQFPYVDKVYFIVDYRLIVCAALLVLYAFRAGHHFSLGSFMPFSRHHSM